MAKSKPTPKPKPKKIFDDPDLKISAADFLNDQIVNAEAKNGRDVLVGTESQRAVIGIPFRALSQQYLYSSTVYPLGRMELVCGESDSCKTAYLFEQMRWFLREPHGGAVYELNEARDPSDLRQSIVGKELLDGGQFLVEGPCKSLENWQRNVTGLLHKFENRFKRTGGVAFPFMIGLDSITGTTNERAIAAIDEQGCAQLTFGQDANLLNQYSKYLFQRLYPWPMSFVTTSHIKWGSDKYNNRVMKIPGGDALRYVSTYILFMKKASKDIERLDVAGGRRLALRTMKSMGEHREIEVEFVWTFEDGEQHSVWNWHGATVELLGGFTGTRRQQLDEIVKFEQFNKTTKLVACSQLGFKKAAPFDEVGAALMENPDVLYRLQDYFGIKRRRAFEPGKAYDRQIQEAIAVGETEAPDTSDIAGVDTSDEGQVAQ